MTNVTIFSFKIVSWFIFWIVIFVMCRPLTEDEEQRLKDKERRLEEKEKIQKEMEKDLKEKAVILNEFENNIQVERSKLKKCKKSRKRCIVM